MEIKPWSNTSTVYKFGKFSRDLSLEIDGKTLTFNTMRPMETENCSIEFDKYDLAVSFNGVQIGQAKNVYMKEPVDIDIKQDFNKHPTCEYSGHLPNGTPIDGTYHVIRHHQNGGSVTPTFVIDSKYLQEDSANRPIIEWEFHLKNVASSTMTVNTPVVYVGDNQNWFSSRTALTDQMYVETGKTNVYVFRADMFDSSKALTYSLAYVY